MASSYTSRIRLEKQGSGENANTWGERLNDNVIDLVDTAVAGVTAVDVDSQTSITLSENNGSTDQGRHAALRFTGALTADVSVTYTSPEKIYFINNESTGGYNVIMNNGSTKVTVGNGAALIATNGSNSFAIRDFESGTRLAFNQDSAPQGWSIVTSASHDNAALRIVNAAVSGGQVGGSNTFNDSFNSGITVSITGQSTESATLTGSVEAVAITTAQLPSHYHFIGNDATAIDVPASSDRAISITFQGNNDFSYALRRSSSSAEANKGRTNTVGTSATHTHSLSGQGPHSHTVSIAQSNAFNLDVKYVNFIVCEKD